MMRHYCLCIYYASTLTRLHLTATIPGTWVSRNKNVKPVWVYCSKRRWKWQCAMGTLGHAKLQSEHHQQQTNTQFFAGQMPFLPPNQECQGTEGKFVSTIVQYFPPTSIFIITVTNEKCSEETQPLCAGCSKVEPKILAPLQTPFPGVRDSQNYQLEMVTTFTYKHSLVRIDARNFELSW